LPKAVWFIRGPLIVNYHYDLITFARMLAKIAHSFAVAELGQENFSPLLLDIILDRDCSHIGSLIGQSETHSPKTSDAPSLHQIWIQVTDDKVRANDLEMGSCSDTAFKPWSDATYTIVAGRVTATRSILKWKGLLG
jgi:hypothetical protein